MRPLVALLLLAAWIGASLLFAAVVAPAAFAALPSRALAGMLVGRILPVVFVAGLLAGVATVALEDRSLAHSRLRLGAGAVLAAACVIAQFVVAPRIQRLRARLGPSIEALAADDPDRLAFGRLHAVSVGWLGLALVAAGVALVSLLLALRSRS